jgi:hypothetical protein
MASDNDKDIEVLKLKYEMVTSRLDRLETDIFKKLDNIELKLDSKINYIDIHLSNHKSNIEQKIEKDLRELKTELTTIKDDLQEFKNIRLMGAGGWKILAVIGGFVAFIVAMSKGILDILK